MDANRFDTLTQRLTAGLNRRRSLGLLATLGLPGLVSANLAQAKKKKKPCPPCKKLKKGKCKKKLPDGTACANGTCQSGSCVAIAVVLSAPASCADGIKNGSETDIDCGGSCTRCDTGKTCSSVNDCQSAVCSGGKCQACNQNDCDQDDAGDCVCRLQIDGEPVCAQFSPTGEQTLTCACPPDTICQQGPETVSCFKRCEAA